MASEVHTDPVAHLRSLKAIRERCGQVLTAARAGKTAHFAVDEGKLDEVAAFVLQVMNDAYPDGIEGVKFHSRWRHFEPSGIDRVGQMRAEWPACDRIEAARRLIDLAVVSVLLDAGAGPAWKYSESGSGNTYARSEGLGVASFHMFKAGAFSSDAAQPFRADAAALKALPADSIRVGFQTEDNPLVGVDGRTELLQRLGRVLEATPQYFGREGSGERRPGHIVDFLLSRAAATADGSHSVSVNDLWEAVIVGLQDMWPATRTSLRGVNMGDVWPHSALGDASRGDGTGLVPFHKLSQWLTYSLMEPLAEGGIAVSDMASMTGLAEYRNGGLLVDLGLLVPKYPEVTSKPHAPDEEVIVEWRALTVALVDEVARRFRALVGKSDADLPLVKILEAGTWKAGRVVAKSLREDGGPPIAIVSDGTVF